jgi:hypothetical protein
MPDVTPPVRRVSRETRLLVVTILVSGLVLLLLSRLRFPEPPAVVTTSAQPLERLAARASFEDLARRVAQIEASIAPNLIVLRLAPRADPPPSRLSDVLMRADPSPADVRHVPALRLDATTALAAIPPDTRISGVVGLPESSGTAGIVATDPVRRLARVRVPEGPARSLPQLPLSQLRTPTYVVAVEGTHAGLTLRPVFLGRSDRFGSPRWTRPMLPLGGIVVTPGALIFTLDGEFLGCAVVEQGILAIAGAAEVVDAVTALRDAVPAPADPGFAVQPLSPALAAATGATHGVVVSEVLEGGAASDVLEPGDVITEVDGQAVDAPEPLLLGLATRLSAGPAPITFLRAGEVHRAELSPAATVHEQTGDPLMLRAVAGVGSRIVSVQPGSAFDAAGLADTDVIVGIGGTRAPSPAQVRRAIAQAAPGASLLFAVRRDDRQRVVAVRLPAGD